MKSPQTLSSPGWISPVPLPILTEACSSPNHLHNSPLDLLYFLIIFLKCMFFYWRVLQIYHRAFLVEIVNTCDTSEAGGLPHTVLNQQQKQQDWLWGVSLAAGIKHLCRYCLIFEVITAAVDTTAKYSLCSVQKRNFKISKNLTSKKPSTSPTFPNSFKISLWCILTIYVSMTEISE